MKKQALIFVWLLLLVFLFLRFFAVFSDKPQIHPGDHVKLTVMLRNEPRIDGNTQVLEIFADKARFRVYTTRFPHYQYGQKLTIVGDVSESKVGKENIGVLDKLRPDLRIYFPKIEAENSALLFITTIRQQIGDSMRGFLPPDEASLLIGMIFGSKEGFSESFLQGLRDTGVLHVVAASGMNVSLLASFLMSFLLRFFNRRVAAVMVICAIILYTLLASLAPSIVRAAIMGGIAFVASALNRQNVAVWGLAIAAYSMLLFDPFLLFDVGFQLSLAATLGLVVVKPMVEKGIVVFAKLAKLPLLGEDVSTTIMAQVTTLPILLGNFGTVSLASVFVNALVLWTVPLVTILGFIAAFLSFFPFINLVPLLAALPLLLFFKTVVIFFDKPFFLLQIKLPIIVGIGYYLIVSAVYLFLKNPRVRSEGAKNGIKDKD